MSRKLPCVRTAAVALVAALGLALAPAALAAGGYAEVVGPAGNVVAVGTGSTFDYPAGGALVHVGHATVTTDGVVLPPSEFAITVGSPPSSVAMHEFVVPRSMPIVFAMRFVSFWKKI